MPPTFLLFLGAIVYIGVTALTLVLALPMLLFDSKQLLAKKILATVLISFPCLVATGIFCTIFFAIPGLAFFWLANGDRLPKTPQIVLAIIGLLIFAGSVVTSSLYLWYFLSKLIYQRLDKKPIKEF